jgi:hypothetical protein
MKDVIGYYSYSIIIGVVCSDHHNTLRPEQTVSRALYASIGISPSLEVLGPCV